MEVGPRPFTEGSLGKEYQYLQDKMIQGSCKWFVTSFC